MAFNQKNWDSKQSCWSKIFQKLPGLLGSCVVLLFSLSVSQAREISLVADEWCPYNCAIGLGHDGILVDLAREIFNQPGEKVTYSILPWARAIRETRAGRHNAIIGAMKPDAPDFLYPSSPQVYSATVIVSRLSQPIRKLEEVRYDRVGNILDYAFGESVDTWLKKLPHGQLITVPGDNDPLARLIAMLESGRIDLFMEDEAVYNYQMSVNPTQSSFHVSRVSDEIDDLYLAFSPSRTDSSELVARLSEAMKSPAIKQKLKEIRAKYGQSTPIY